jgi:hypothetical protein
LVSLDTALGLIVAAVFLDFLDFFEVAGLTEICSNHYNAKV